MSNLAIPADTLPALLSPFGIVRQGGDHALLAVRRAVRNFVDCPAAVCSVCVLLLNKEEHPPPGYRVIQKVRRLRLVSV